MVVEGSWLNQSDDVIVGHGVSLLRWRSGGVKHPHDMPPSRFPPSPTSGHSSRNASAILNSLIASSATYDCGASSNGKAEYRTRYLNERTWSAMAFSSPAIRAFESSNGMSQLCAAHRLTRWVRSLMADFVAKVRCAIPNNRSASHDRGRGSWRRRQVGATPGPKALMSLVSVTFVPSYTPWLGAGSLWL